MAGMRNARVLPVPVLALQTRSAPDMKTGSEAAWTLVQVSYCIVSKALQGEERLVESTILQGYKSSDTHMHIVLRVPHVQPEMKVRLKKERGAHVHDIENIAN